MKKRFSKKSIVLGTVVLSSITPLAMAQNVKITNKKKNPPRTQKAKTSVKTTCKNDKSKCYQHSRIQIGPYLNRDRLFDGSELLINVSSMREDARLLLQKYNLEQECNGLGMPLPGYPSLMISGKLEGLFSYNNPYVGKSNTTASFDEAELDLYLQVNKWLSAYAAIEYSPTPAKGDHKVFMNRGFVTLGNLDVTPFYVSAGKMYVPFGRYSSSMVSTPATESLGRILANTVVFGYQQTGDNALHAEGYIYQGLTHYRSDKEKSHIEFGGDAGYSYKVGQISGEVGAGAVSNLADSQGMQASIFDNDSTFVYQRVPAVDVYGSIAYKNFNLLTEFITATKKFNHNNLAYDGRGARPSAINTELSYNFKTAGRPSSIAVGYSGSSQAVSLGIPKSSYLVAYNINILRNTNLAIEYRHSNNYSVAEARGTGLDSTPTPFGKSENAISVQFDYFF